MGLTQGVAAVTAVFVTLNPVVFYWTVVNPMETCMTLVLTVLTAEWLHRTALHPQSKPHRMAPPHGPTAWPHRMAPPHGPTAWPLRMAPPHGPTAWPHRMAPPHGPTAWPLREGMTGGLWIFALSLIRPELLTAAPIAALAFLLGQGG